MAQTQIVQDYLKRHQIGPLFEDLMSRVIKDLPEEPAIYLIRILQRKYDKTGVVRHSDIVRGSRSRSPSPTRKGPDHGLQRWTVAGDSMAVAKSKTRPRKATDVTFSTTKPQVRRSTGTKPEWDASKQAQPTSFDDLFNDGRPTSKSQQFRRSKNSSPTRRVSNFDSNGEDQEDLLFRSYGYRGPKKSYSSADPLAGEFTNARETKTKEKSFSKVQSSRSIRGSKAKSANNNHKRDLERMVKQSQQEGDSGYEESRDIEPDNAIEIMEDVDILRSEGVKVKGGSTGVRLPRSRTRATGSTEQVRVSICARCANVMNGVKSEPQRSFGDLPSFGYETDRTFPETSPDFPEAPERPMTSQSNRSVRFSPGPSDDEDEFESVSQVTGPRRPVWQDDSDGEAVTPRKGAHMFKSSAVPSKGRPMYSADQSRVKANVLSASLPQGQVKGQLAAFNQSWAPGDIQESSEEQPKESENLQSSSKTDITEATEKDEDVPPGGQGWAAPVTDNETDASTFVYGRKDTRSY